jgi:RNase P/RNase MRP subunit POP5
MVPSQKEVYHAIREAAVELFGDVGFAQMHVAVVWLEGEHVIIRCKRGLEQRVIACTAVITKFHGFTMVFRTVAMSGTIHGAKNHIKSTTWDCEILPGYRCSGKKVDCLTGNNTQSYLTREDIHKE